MAKKSLTKTQLIKEIAEAAGITNIQSKAALEALVALSYNYATADKGFTIPGLGKLIVRKRKARMGRNPQTGEAIKIPAKKVLKFTIAKAAKDATL